MITEASSFRDPDGFVFYDDGVIYRQVNHSYRENYDALMGSGLYEELIKSGLLICNYEVIDRDRLAAGAYRILKPEIIPFISYPYEWSFSQLKDAALLTLKVQKACLEKGMSLKDASAYNIQFKNGAPVFIDILSFEKLKEGAPWDAYGQFCRHFLAPLCLAAKRDVRMIRMSENYIDGIPLDLASKLLPRNTYFNPGILMHLHIHALSSKHFADRSIGEAKNRKISRFALLAIIDGLKTAVMGLKCGAEKNQWTGYYENSSYSHEAFEDKKRIVSIYFKSLQIRGMAWDIGANTGVFSRLASEAGFETISFDMDPAAVEINYLINKKTAVKNVLPLVLDLFNPTPAVGWALAERKSITQRGPCDCAVVLALVHHLAIAGNVPLDKIASFFPG